MLNRPHGYCNVQYGMHAIRGDSSNLIEHTKARVGCITKSGDFVGPHKHPTITTNNFGHNSPLYGGRPGQMR